jgi:hypothetical protein
MPLILPRAGRRSLGSDRGPTPARSLAAAGEEVTGYYPVTGRSPRNDRARRACTACTTAVVTGVACRPGRTELQPTCHSAPPSNRSGLTTNSEYEH